jgi:hypothetical protein
VSIWYITKITRVVKQSPYQYLTFFEYNADGRLSKKTDYDGTYSTFGYKNGDLSVEQLYDSKGTLTMTNTYTPDPDKTGADLPTEVSEETAFYVLGLFGKPASHPAKQMTSTANKSSTDYYVTDYTHSFDPTNNMTGKLATTNLKSISSSSVYPVSTFSTNYTYLCQ